MNESGGAPSVVGVPGAPVTSAGSVGADSSDSGVRNTAFVTQIWGSRGRVSGSNSGEKEKSRNPTPESRHPRSFGAVHKSLLCRGESEIGVVKDGTSIKKVDSTPRKAQVIVQQEKKSPDSVLAELGFSGGGGGGGGSGGSPGGGGGGGGPSGGGDPTYDHAGRSEAGLNKALAASNPSSH